MKNQLLAEKLETLRSQIKKNRRELLDVFELVFGSDPRWSSVRSKILDSFGREGLEGLANELIQINGRE